jgi:hypothetical protein
MDKENEPDERELEKERYTKFDYNPGKVLLHLYIIRIGISCCYD